MSAPEWELKLELTRPNGSRLSDLFIFRARASECLSVDINLLSSEFKTAVRKL